MIFFQLFSLLSRAMFGSSHGQFRPSFFISCVSKHPTPFYVFSFSIFTYICSVQMFLSSIANNCQLCHLHFFRNVVILRYHHFVKITSTSLFVPKKGFNWSELAVPKKHQVFWCVNLAEDSIKWWRVEWELVWNYSSFSESVWNQWRSWRKSRLWNCTLMTPAIVMQWKRSMKGWR